MHNPNRIELDAAEATQEQLCYIITMQDRWVSQCKKQTHV